MLLTKNIGRNALIKIEQTTLNKFFPQLPESEVHSLIKRLKQMDRLSDDEGYTLRMTFDGTIYIKEEHCLDCGRRLIKNGFNRRIAILAGGLGRHEFCNNPKKYIKRKSYLY